MDVKRLRGVPARLIAGLENTKIPFVNYILVFFSVVFIRYFIESFSQTSNQFNLPSYYMGAIIVHFLFSFAAIIILFGMGMHYAVKVPIEKVFRVLVPCMLLILLGPIFDIIITHGRGVNILYLQSGLGADIWKSYYTYYSGFRGVSSGLRLEGLAIFLCCFIYFITKGCGYLYSLLLVVAAYTVLFLWGAAPLYVEAILNFLGYHYRYSNGVMLVFFALTDFVLLIWVSYLFNEKIFKSLLKDIRGLRIGYYELSLLFGAALALSLQSESTLEYLRLYPSTVIGILFSLVSVFFACMFSLMINNIYDVTIDKVNSPARPLVTGEINNAVYKRLAFLFMGLSFCYASLINAQVVLLVGVVSASYYLYSVPPLRIKRVAILSKLVISVNAFALVYLGFILVQHSAERFPQSLFWIYLIGVTVAANFIDLKDVTGNKIGRVVTLPALMGAKRAKLVIGAAFFFVAVAYGFVLQSLWLVPMLIIVGALYFYLINKKIYEDSKVMLLTNISMFVMSVYLIF